ncbi:MAG: hypothetical protein ACXVDA_10150, partial [Ktedonobacterales bacterium]
MAAPNRPPRTRASGGRTLMLLGVLLALAAGAIVIYIVSTAVGAGSQTTTVWAATKDLPAGSILTVQPTDASKSYLSIGEAFAQKTVTASFVPQTALPYISQEDLNIKLNNQVIVGAFYAGDILRQSDPRLVQVGTGAAGSLTNINPAQLPKGSILAAFDVKSNSGAVGGTPIAHPGDYVDFLAFFCPKAQQGGTLCQSQTTLQNIYIYTVVGASIVVVLTPKQALQLQYLQQDASSLEIVVRKPGDTNPVNTSAVTEGTIVSDFHFKTT